MIIGFGISPSRVKASAGVSYDADAQAFFTAASITDVTQKNAVNQLVIDLKSYGVWDKCKAIYPICGGSASSHAVNLKTPGTYNLTFSTGWTHASTGMTPATAYADTAIIPSSVLTTNNNHISYYSRTNIGEVGICMGCSDGSSEVPIMYLNARNTSNVAQFYNQDTAAGTFVNASNTDSKGFYISNRTANNVMKGFKNGSQIGTTGTTTTTRLLPSTRTLILGAYNYAVGTPFIVGYGTKQCVFASIGDGLTDTEASNFYTAVQAYQTTLSRNV